MYRHTNIMVKYEVYVLLPIVTSAILCCASFPTAHVDPLAEPFWSQPWIKRDDINATACGRRLDVYQDPRFPVDFVVFDKINGEIKDCWYIRTDYWTVTNISCGFEISNDVVRLKKRPKGIADPWWFDYGPLYGRLMGYAWDMCYISPPRLMRCKPIKSEFPQFKDDVVSFWTCDYLIRIEFPPGAIPNKALDEPLWSSFWIQRVDIEATFGDKDLLVYQDPRFITDFLVSDRPKNGQIRNCWLVRVDRKSVSRLSCDIFYDIQYSSIRLKKRPAKLPADPWWHNEGPDKGHLKGYYIEPASADERDSLMRFTQNGQWKSKGDVVTFTEDKKEITIIFPPGIVK